MDKETIQRILSACDHTLLRPDADWDEIRTICDDARKYRTASICIPPSFVARCAQYLHGDIPVCTVIGFPNGYNTPSVKAFEAKEAVQCGADEVDMVIDLGRVKEGDFDFVLSEIRLVREAVPDQILKVIIETCLLSQDEKKRMCEVVTKSGADFIKTSTGFSSGGATFEDVALMKKYVGENVRIKAAGGISSLEDGLRFLELGASRLGTSRVIKIVKPMVDFA